MLLSIEWSRSWGGWEGKRTKCEVGNVEEPQVPARASSRRLEGIITLLGRSVAAEVAGVRVGSGTGGRAEEGAGRVERRVWRLPTVSANSRASEIRPNWLLLLIETSRDSKSKNRVNFPATSQPSLRRRNTSTQHGPAATLLSA